MSLFEVPGWSVPSAPVQDRSRKRKRPIQVTDDTGKVHTAEINVEKLMKKMDAAVGPSDERAGSSRGKKRTKRDASPADGSKKPRQKSGSRQAGQKDGVVANKTPKTPHGRVDAVNREDSASMKSKKVKQRDKEAPSTHSTPTSKAHASPDKNLTALQSGMKNSLDGARFRWINEVLYKSDSTHAHEMMRSDPAVFREYHKGFRHQVESWPSNPVSHYISTLSSYPPKTVIADLGCGDAALARALIPKGFAVLSYDLVSDGVFVTEADIFGRIPLPGSGDSEDTNDETEGSGQVVDVVICALSLMGTNWPRCVGEAWRILRPGGELKVAEVASRFSSAEEFTSLVSFFGFRLKASDDSNSHFTLFDFKKVGRRPKSEKEWEKLLAKGGVLKPCEYKRR
ncbi:methyltransferase-domain-containing protein [Amylostereum chailletii]|nr:methyltransferase-domain-containing protein [Amylostereum chailletii]